MIQKIISILILLALFVCWDWYFMWRRKRAFIICTVRDAAPEYREKLELYVRGLEWQGYKVHLPHRDTKQDATSMQICKQNLKAVRWAYEIHVFYSSKSMGTHFDMGMAFALNKKVVIAENEPIISPGKSFPDLLETWDGSKARLKKLKQQLGV